MQYFVITFLALVLPALVSSQINCHRCFGNGYCNDANHADFSENVWNATCPTPSTSNSLDIEDDDPFMAEVEKVINRNMREQFDDQTSPYTTVEENVCLTATVHEAHDNHTLRTCYSRLVNTNGTSPALCDVIGTAIASANYYNGSFSCMTCNTNFCNTHTLRLGDGPNGSNIATVSLLMIMVAGLLQFQLM